MNVFFTDYDVNVCAYQHCKVHVNKMIIEYAQLLSTAHRLLEGELETVYIESLDADNNVIYRKKKWYTLPCDTFKYVDGKKVLAGYVYYAATHINHPSAVWARQARGNYQWLFKLLTALCTLYKKNKFIEHSTASILSSLKNPPKNIPTGAFFEPPQCMPDEYKQKSTCKAYKNYLQSKYSEWQSRAKPIKVEFYSNGQ